MENNDVQRLQGDGVSNILPINSNVFTKKRISFAKQASDFIKEHKLSNENRSVHPAFKSLKEPKLKQAIRYQLRKKDGGKKATKISPPPSPSTRVPINRRLDLNEVSLSSILPSFLKFLVGCWITYILIGESVGFYVSKGFLPAEAEEYALLVEVVICSLSLSDRFFLKTFAYILLVLNCFTFSYKTFTEGHSEVQKKLNNIKFIEYSNKEIKRLESSILSYKNKITKEEESKAEGMNTRFKTKAFNRHQPLINKYEGLKLKAEDLLIKEKKTLKELEIKNATHSIGEVKEDQGMPIITLVMMVTRWILQLVAIFFFHGFGHEFQRYLKTRKMRGQSLDPPKI